MKKRMTVYFPNMLITGKQGQMGQALCKHLQDKEVQVIACTREELNICDANSIQQAIEKYAPAVLINTAAYTAVDLAEQESALAMRINHEGATMLAAACQKYHLPLIHLSTDYVFDGKKNKPYVETDEAHPLNVYGKSKYLGELAIQEQCEQHIILRVSGIFSAYRKNFLKTVLRLKKEKKLIRMVDDQFTCPTAAHDIAACIFALLKKPLTFGTYHFCSQTAVSWQQFASAILQEEVQGISSSDYHTAAKRPAYSVLDCQKIKNDYGIVQPDWQQAIQEVLKDESLSST
jgi:dTDP-4-dehydrorhamnose reductase